jgi:predicted translin family RNA/ssDNA-binding protein
MALSVWFDIEGPRVRQYGSPLPESTLKDISPFVENCQSSLSSLVPELQGINAWRYHRQVSPGIQEFMEALIFSHYLQNRHLLDMPKAQALLPSGIHLTEEDWLGGVMDSVGECMRWAITGMASQGKIPGETGEDIETRPDRNIAQDLRELRVALEALRIHGFALGKDAGKKMDVMRTSVNKVESAAYGLIVRGQERPKGWVPTFNEQAVLGSERE